MCTEASVRPLRPGVCSELPDAGAKNPSPLHEQQSLLTADLSLQPHEMYFIYIDLTSYI